MFSTIEGNRNILPINELPQFKTFNIIKDKNLDDMK